MGNDTDCFGHANSNYRSLLYTVEGPPAEQSVRQRWVKHSRPNFIFFFFSSLPHFSWVIQARAPLPCIPTCLPCLNYKPSAESRPDKACAGPITTGQRPPHAAERLHECQCGFPQPRQHRQRRPRRSPRCRKRSLCYSAAWATFAGRQWPRASSAT